MEERPETPGFRRFPSRDSEEDPTQGAAGHAGGAETWGRPTRGAPAGGAEWAGQREGKAPAERGGRGNDPGQSLCSVGERRGWGIEGLWLSSWVTADYAHSSNMEVKEPVGQEDSEVGSGLHQAVLSGETFSKHIPWAADRIHTLPRSALAEMPTPGRSNLAGRTVRDPGEVQDIPMVCALSGDVGSSPR